jgi:hypothetical protein
MFFVVAAAFDGDDCGRGSGIRWNGGDGAGPILGGKRRRQAQRVGLGGLTASGEGTNERRVCGW